jgi:hypothetical protein
MTEKENPSPSQTTVVSAEMCECGRLYKSHRDEAGKLVCPACYTGLESEDLKKLWGKPMPDGMRRLFIK